MFELLMGNMFRSSGFVLLLTLILMVSLSAIVGALIVSLTTDFRNAAVQANDAKALWLAEAGLQKAIWNLKTPSGSGGQGENWTTTGVTETLGDGSYTVVATRWDFALATNGASASATSTSGTNTPAKAIDGSNLTYWESQNVPTPALPQEITISFPYKLTLNKVRFLVPSGSTNNRPRRYSWQVSSDGTTYTTVFNMLGSNNSSTDVTNTFSVALNPAAANVNFLRLHVERTGTGSSHVRIATLEAIGSKITSTGTVNTQTRSIERTLVADDGSPENQKAYNEIDWKEI